MNYFSLKMCRLHRFIDIARDISQTSNMHYKLGALVIKNGKIVGRGFNNSLRTCVDGKLYPGVHAEFGALRDYASKKSYNKQTKKIDLLVVRFTKNEIPVISKPCIVCLSYIIKMGVRRVFYFNESGKIECKKPGEIDGTESKGLKNMITKMEITNWVKILRKID